MARTKKQVGIGALALALALGASACSDSDGVGVGGTTRLTVLLTDAPTDYIEAAMVDIGAVVLVPADGSPHITLSDDGTDGPVNLLELQDAATEVLAEAEIEAGSYTQLRLIVESASVTLKDPYTFTDGSTEKALKVPSGAQTGIKLLLGAGDGEGDEPLEIPAGDLALVVDFDVSQSFVIQGNPLTPAGIHGMLFKPTLRVVVLDVAGSIAGTVSTDLDSTLVDSLEVTATPTDEGLVEAYQTSTATGRTRADGTYTLPFVVPGEYVVRVTPPDTTLAIEPDSIVVLVDLNEDVVGVDFTLDSIP
jgi:hypothetical protein